MHFLHFLIRSCVVVAQRNVDSVDFRSVLSSRRGRESMRWIGGCFMQHHRRFYTHHPVRSPDERQKLATNKNERTDRQNEEEKNFILDFDAGYAL